MWDLRERGGGAENGFLALQSPKSCYFRRPEPAGNHPLRTFPDPDSRQRWKSALGGPAGFVAQGSASSGWG